MKKLVKAKDIIEELKQTDIETYEEIKHNTELVRNEWGGKRENAGRKPKTGNVLEFRIRVSKKEKEFIDYARAHNLNYDDLMQG